MDTLKKKTRMTDSKRKYENDLSSFRKDIDEMEITIQKAEQEKTNRDHTIRNKEKKHAVETQSKSSDELSSSEEKMDALNKVKIKL